MFNPSNLSVLAYANNFTLWHYAATDQSIGDIGEAGYFNGASDMMKSHDRIIVCAKDQVRDLTVTWSEPGDVRVWLPGVFGHGFEQAQPEEQPSDTAAAA